MRKGLHKHVDKGDDHDERHEAHRRAHQQLLPQRLDLGSRGPRMGEPGVGGEKARAVRHRQWHAVCFGFDQASKRHQTDAHSPIQRACNSIESLTRSRVATHRLARAAAAAACCYLQLPSLLPGLLPQWSEA